MRLLRRMFFALVQVIELPVNLLLELWRIPGRGRGLLFGFPSILVLMLTLLAVGWAKYGSNQELIGDYWREHRRDKDRLNKLNEELGKKPLDSSFLGEPEEVETAAPVESAPSITNEGDSAEIVEMVQREIDEPKSLEFTGNPRTVVRIQTNVENEVESAEIVEPSEHPEWDAAVRTALLKTGAVRRARGDDRSATSLDLVFGLLDTHREKLMYKMVIGLKKLIDLEPSKPQFKFEYAILSGEMGRPLEAKLMMDQVAAADKPGLCEGHIWQARQIWADEKSNELVASKRERCMNHLRLALASDPTNIEANEGLGELFFSLGNFAEAEQHYRLVWEHQLSTTLRLIAIYKQQNNFVKLNEVLSKTKLRLEEELKKDPNNITYILDIQRIYLLQEENQEAIEFLLSQRNDQNKDVIDSRIARIYVVWAQKDEQNLDGVFSKEAFEKTKKALEYDPKIDDAFWILTVIGTQDQPFASEARALYDPVQHRADAPALVLREYATYLIKQDQRPEAILWLEEAYNRFAGDPVTANNLAYLLLTTEPPNPERALMIIDKAIEITTMDAPAKLRSSLYDTKASVLVALNRHVEAIPFLEASLQFRVNDRPTMVALRECYQAIGQTDMADFYQRRIDEFVPAPNATQ